MNAITLKSRLLVLLLAATLPLAAAAAERTSPVPAWRYTVRPGDTLIQIAERYLVDGSDWQAIQKDNQVDDPYRLLPGTVLRLPAALLRRSPAEVTVVASAGNVRLRSGGGDWQEAASGQRLAAGSTLETLDDGHATLRLADGSTLLLAPNSQLVFDALGVYARGLMVDTRLRLQRGHGDIDANPARRANRHLQIQTPSAQVVVRGTQFRVSVDDDTTREGTLAGLVAVSGDGRAVQVAQGRGTIVRRGEAPSAPVALLAAPDVSALPERFEHLPLRFALPRLPGAEAWHGQIAAAQAPDHIRLSKTARGEALTFADLPNGDYLLRLRAVHGNGLHGIEAVHRFVLFARPFPPGLNHPGDAATIRSARPTFAWGSVVGVRDYHLQVASRPDFAHPLQAASSAENHWEAPADLPAGLLYWRAASVDEAGQQGPWSVASEFTYKPGPGPVDLGRAAIEVGSDGLVLKLPPPPEGLVYEAILSSAADLQPILAQAQAPASEGRLDLPRPDGGSYYLGIRLLDPVDQTPGPLAVQRLEVPYSRLWLLLLLLPLAAL
ncbi:MAG: FecR domain-containing protein [Candidatus Accumulibacter sp.]|uniref:FecR domain-containing protein n=1 Tax=Candidatus Accumulibacter affinis TaxID=2954384 RepID=A0A935TAI5_9PROT|nr:FecR domain-containing protein [Candidatus Accumulibacter affinis]